MDENPYESPKAQPDPAPPPQTTYVPPLLAYAIIIAFTAIAMAIRWLTLPRLK